MANTPLKRRRENMPVCMVPPWFALHSFLDAHAALGAEHQPSVNWHGDTSAPLDDNPLTQITNRYSVVEL